MALYLLSGGYNACYSVASLFLIYPSASSKLLRKYFTPCGVVYVRRESNGLILSIDTQVYVELVTILLLLSNVSHLKIAKKTKQF